MADQKKHFSVHFEKFESYCKPKSNNIYSRYQFKSRIQEESFEHFVTDLKVIFKEYGYQTGVEDEMIRDHIVFGVKSTKVREILLNEGNCANIGKVHGYCKNI